MWITHLTVFFCLATMCTPSRHPLLEGDDEGDPMLSMSIAGTKFFLDIPETPFYSTSSTLFHAPSW